MELLSITLDVGSGASPAKLESLVRAIRVAGDVGRAAEVARIRRSATERSKFPTDRDLSLASERLARGDESSPSYRAQRLLDVRNALRDRFRGLPPELWWEERFWLGGLDRKFLQGTGYERMLDSYPALWGGATMGLDSIDPDLHAALVSDEVSRRTPEEFSVRSIRYENPFGEEIIAADQAASALSKTAGVIETAATLGSRRKVAKAEGDYAQAVVEDRIESSRLDVEMKREALRAQQLANQRAEQELLALHIENARALRELDADRRQQAVVERLTQEGQLDEADVVAKLDVNDADALTQFAAHPLQLDRRHEPDLET